MPCKAALLLTALLFTAPAYRLTAQPFAMGQGASRPQTVAADTHLHVWTSRVTQIDIWGYDRDWQKRTGDVCFYNLKMTNQCIIKRVLRQFQFTNQTKMSAKDLSLDDTGNVGGPTVEVCQGRNADIYAYIDYLHRGRVSEVITVLDPQHAVGGPGSGFAYRGPLKPGNGRRFESLVRRLLRRARRHDPAITVLQM